MGKKDEKVPHICPWYMAYLFDNPLRRLVHDPARVLGPYIEPGMLVLDIGCGMGHFSLGMARLVGPEGRVISIDVQEKMLQIMIRRAVKRGLSDRIEGRLVGDGPLPVHEPADFALCFWMVHEVPDQSAFFSNLNQALEPGAVALIAEPAMHHVTPEDLEETISLASQEGFMVSGRPKIRMSHSVLLKKEL